MPSTRPLDRGTGGVEGGRVAEDVDIARSALRAQALGAGHRSLERQRPHPGIGEQLMGEGMGEVQRLLQEQFTHRGEEVPARTCCMPGSLPKGDAPSGRHASGRGHPRRERRSRTPVLEQTRGGRALAEGARAEAPLP